MEPANAWERAKEAIARAEERDADVVTPDNAQSPFDASATMILPVSQGPRRGPGRAPYPPAPRRPPERHTVPDEPPTTPVEVSDPAMPGGPVRASRPVQLRPAPSPAPAPAPAQNPSTAPFPVAEDGSDIEDADTVTDEAALQRPAPARSSRPRWRRLFRRGQ